MHKWHIRKIFKTLIYKGDLRPELVTVTQLMGVHKFKFHTSYFHPFSAIQVFVSPKQIESGTVILVKSAVHWAIAKAL